MPSRPLWLFAGQVITVVGKPCYHSASPSCMVAGMNLWDASLLPVADPSWSCLFGFQSPWQFLFFFKSWPSSL